MGSLRAVSWLLVSGWLAGVTPQAHARARTFSLHWVREPGAEACITGIELARVVERDWGKLFVAPSEAELAIEGRVQRDTQTPGWSARISLSDREGRVLGARELTTRAAECRALNVQLGLVVALLVDPEITQTALPSELIEALRGEGDAAAELLDELAAARQTGARTAEPSSLASAPDALPTPTPTPTTARPHEAPAAAATAPPDFIHVRAGYAAGLGLLPNPCSGPWLEALLRASGALWVGLRSVLWLPNDVPLMAAHGGAEVQFAMSNTSALACLDGWRAGSIRWDACAGVSLGVRWSNGGAALERPTDLVRWTLAPTLTTQLRYEPWSHVFAVATVALDVPIRRQTFVYSDARGEEHDLFTPGIVAPWLGLGAGAAF